MNLKQAKNLIHKSEEENRKVKTMNNFHRLLIERCAEPFVPSFLLHNEVTFKDVRRTGDLYCVRDTARFWSEACSLDTPPDA
jgi:hypothetical protein